MKVAILGCGPAGLMAAHAVAEAKHTPVIFSRRVPSAIGGAQFLHEPLPGITSDLPDGRVNFIKYGTDRGYSKKVYGDPYYKTSWWDYEEGHRNIWNLRKAYEKLWNRYEKNVVDLKLDHDTVTDILAEKYQMVMSTIPAFALCGNPSHVFDSQDVWIVYGQAVAEGGEDRIIYDGTTDFPWYRWSYIFGWKGVEYSHKVGNSQHIRKPLTTNCDCHAEVVRLGRYGKWKKGELTHHAYEGAKHEMLKLQ